MGVVTERCCRKRVMVFLYECPPNVLKATYAPFCVAQSLTARSLLAVSGGRHGSDSLTHLLHRYRNHRHKTLPRGHLRSLRTPFPAPARDRHAIC